MQPQQQNNSELDPNSYPHPVSTSAADHQFESQMMSQMQRPNSIEVCIFLHNNVPENLKKPRPKNS